MSDRISSFPQAPVAAVATPSTGGSAPAAAGQLTERVATIAQQKPYIPEALSDGRPLDRAVVIFDLDGTLRNEILRKTAQGMVPAKVEKMAVEALKRLSLNPYVKQVIVLSGSPMDNERTQEWRQPNIPIREAFSKDDSPACIFAKEIESGKMRLFGCFGGQELQADGTMKGVDQFPLETSFAICRIMIEKFLQEIIEKGTTEQQKVARELQSLIPQELKNHAQPQNRTPDEFGPVAMAIREKLDHGFKEPGKNNCYNLIWLRLPICRRSLLVQSTLWSRRDPQHLGNLAHPNCSIYSCPIPKIVLNGPSCAFKTVQFHNVISQSTADLVRKTATELLSPDSSPSASSGIEKSEGRDQRYLVLSKTNKRLTTQRSHEEAKKQFGEVSVVAIGDGKEDFQMFGAADLGLFVGPEDMFKANPLPQAMLVRGQGGEANQHTTGTVEVINRLIDGLGKPIYDLQYISHQGPDGKWSLVSPRELGVTPLQSLYQRTW